MTNMAGKRKFRTTCTRDCWDACGIIAHAENDRIVRLEGDRQHPFTRGFLCGKTYRFLDRFYSKERILWPLLRVGEGWKPTFKEAGCSLPNSNRYNSDLLYST